MGSESNAIAEHIRDEREQLGRDLRELESMVREEPRRWFNDNLPRIVVTAFGAFFLIGFFGANRRRRSRY
jgi:hypothetical protein